MTEQAGAAQARLVLGGLRAELSKGRSRSKGEPITCDGPKASGGVPENAKREKSEGKDALEAIENAYEADERRRLGGDARVVDPSKPARPVDRPRPIRGTETRLP